jgi:cytochrome c556
MRRSGSQASVGAFMSKIFILGVAIGTVAADAQEAKQTPGERAVLYRQSLYTVLGANFGAVHTMADGKAPFSAADAQKFGDRTAFIAKMTAEALPAESNGAGKTQAKPEIWQQAPEFQKQVEALIDKSSVLAAAARTGDLGKIKRASDETAETCKSCHEKFRQRE